MLSYPTLYNIIRTKNISVAKVLSRRPLNMFFRSAIVGNNLNLWLELVGRVLHVQFNDRSDNFVWLLNKESFSVDSMHNDMMKETMLNENWIPSWKIKIPLKIQVFLWYLRRGITLLTKDN